MRPELVRLAWLLLVGLGLACGMPLSAAQPDYQEKTEELQLIKSRIKELQSKLEQTKGRQQQQNIALRETDQHIGALARRVRVIEVGLKRQQRRMGKLERQRADARLQLDKHRQSVERQIRSAYAMGRQEKIKILLSQQDPAVVSRVMVYYDYLNAARLKQMAEIHEVLQRLNLIEQEIVQEEQRLQQLQAKANTEQQRLELAKRDREQLIASLNRQLASKGVELSQLQEDETQLSSLLSSLQQALADIPVDPMQQKPFSVRKGKLQWPSRGRLTAGFGSPRNVGELQWDGVVIAAPEGGEVKAVHRGRVAFADWMRGFGLLLILDHGDGYMSLYGYNQSLFKETGEWVEPGEVVALVGSSGGRPSPGVYFAIRHNGRAVNPKKWCRRSRGNRVGWLVEPPQTRVADKHGIAPRSGRADQLRRAA
ncbi:murein hydrolase activator EnvC family protein [endosymbiont of Ridgeia piscesae]|jgi:septal ring factor EnvC (AmiA/AmiB activator)|uniref:Septal ring factor EnvC, activator of murein hydrolases AmiA and AmiB n=1 Tax=endosymbiont of Ridgeia piscesae TaxID=54398 RepID=A0A0T5Z835_9GAMM|nr:peptidoglycan DD-metalloendopeptidase family protein [endosymbiont of Ridgeia piscesae]KRT53979.1 Septal ring factor EnvC, activator of murein hydrolases AmiA and AmiB [endosymbiont of Ridgeia piscesae]KRT58801.1 Septal ring factor EnvC, activator of murein hydrolases AmiA and AmiB [endosymbiont of Ridgeia piscesae]